eukprot:3542325-Prorocentrum_lima.AAC.1
MRTTAAKGGHLNSLRRALPIVCRQLSAQGQMTALSKSAGRGAGRLLSCLKMAFGTCCKHVSCSQQS